MKSYTVSILYLVQHRHTPMAFRTQRILPSLRRDPHENRTVPYVSAIILKIHSPSKLVTSINSRLQL